jgi:hypothetical protein
LRNMPFDILPINERRSCKFLLHEYRSGLYNPAGHNSRFYEVY